MFVLQNSRYTRHYMVVVSHKTWCRVTGVLELQKVNHNLGGVGSPFYEEIIIHVVHVIKSELFHFQTLKPWKGHCCCYEEK